jgi:hypothetical protein
MAISWSWAFGNESGIFLENMGWVLESTSSARGQPDSTIVYSYAGSPTRYSWAQDANSGGDEISPPLTTFQPQGWITFAVYYDAASLNFFSNPIRIAGSGSTIYLRHDGAGVISLFVRNTLKTTFNDPLLTNQWNYIAVKYDMTTTTLSAQVYFNGVEQTTLQTQTGGGVTTNGQITLLGSTSGTRTTYFGQIIQYDDPADAGETPYFVTRCDPLSDRATSGTWTSTGANNFSQLGSPFDPLSYVQNASPSTGDYVECRASPLSDASQLNLSGVTVAAITTHDYTEGTGVSARCGIADAAATVFGDPVTPTASTTSYCFATSDQQPSGGNWVTGSSVIVRHEIV